MSPIRSARVRRESAPRRAGTRLELFVLGGFEARAGRTLEGFESRKTRGLLAYLAMLDGRAAPREHLTALFWPDFGADSARRNLRQALHNLRGVLGGARDRIEIDAYEVRMPADRLRLDARQFESAVRDGLEGRGPASVAALARALDTYRGELLAGLNVRDAQPFEEWLAAERARLLELAVEAAKVALRRTESDGLQETALRFAMRLAELEPVSEEACRARMRLLAGLGRRTGALAAFADFESLLDRELGVRASAETFRLVDAIRSEEALPGPTPGGQGPTGPVVPLVGRELERKALGAVWAQVRAGAAQWTLLLGDSGTGKSRLLRSFLLQALEGGAGSVLLTRCRAGAPDALRALLVDAVASLPMSLPDTLGTPYLEAAGHAIAALPEIRALRRDLPAGPRTTALRPLAAVGSLLRTLARAGGRRGRGWPAVLFVEDLERAPELIDALFELLDAVRGLPVWIVAAARTDELGAANAEALRRATSERGGSVVELGRLPADEVGRAARSLVGEPAADELAAALFEVSAGLPVALAEAVNLLADERVLTTDERGRWQVARPDALREDLPSGIDALLDRRIELVPHTSRRLLGLAAVVGEQFDTETLLEVDREHPAVLDAALRVCVERWLIRPYLRSWVAHRSDRDVAIWSYGPRRGPFEFSQRLMHDRLYRAIEPKRRRFLEEEVAKVVPGRPGRLSTSS